MKKKVIINKQKLTREAHLYSPPNDDQSNIPFKPMAKPHTIEKLNGFWKINFNEKK